MALFVSGMPCAICGRPIQDDERVVTFSPFVANKKDALHLFSDAVLHDGCFASHPLAARARAAHDSMHRAMGDPQNRICIACEQRIVDPDDYFTTGYLTDDRTDPLHGYNFVQLHRSHLDRWPRFAEFRRLFENLRANGGWDGPALV